MVLYIPSLISAGKRFCLNIYRPYGISNNVAPSAIWGSSQSNPPKIIPATRSKFGVSEVLCAGTVCSKTQYFAGDLTNALAISVTLDAPLSSGKGTLTLWSHGMTSNDVCFAGTLSSYPRNYLCWLYKTTSTRSKYLKNCLFTSEEANYRWLVEVRMCSIHR